MSLIRRTVQAASGLALLAMFGYPLLAVWLDHHPETAKALAVSAEMADPDAGVLTRGRQMIGSYAQAKQDVATQASERAADEAYEEAERKRERMRRFNAGDTRYEDY